MTIKSISAMFASGLLALSLSSVSLSVQAEGEGGGSKLSVTVTHNGKTIEITRNTDKAQEISEDYRSTHRGVIQKMNPFAPNQVATIGEREMLDYLKQKASGDDNILIIDSRTARWVEKGTIPSSVNISFKEFDTEERTAEIMEDDFGAVAGTNAWDFQYAKTLVMFCNGAWCGQSPIAIKKLLRAGYPAAKIKYYRGGMQSWLSLGLTTVKPETVDATEKK